VKPSRFSPFQRSMSMVAIGALLFMSACGGGSPLPTSSMPEMDTQAEQSPSGNGMLRAMDDENGYEYGAMNLGARGENFSNDATFAPGSAITVKITTVHTDGEASGDAHCAIFDHTKPVGEQDLIDSSFKPGGWRHSDLSFMLTVHAPTTCGRQYQLDCGLGKRPPVGAQYTNDLIRAWHFGTDLCNETRLTPTPTPPPTPTPVTPTPTPTRPPHCEDGHGQDNEHGNCVPDPTPTPRSTPTMTPTSTPRPTATPTPRPTSTPVPTCENTPATSSAGQNFVLGNSSSSTETSWVNNNVDPGPYEFWDKDDDFDSHCTTAWFSAKVVLLKAGTQYRYFLNVTSGQQLCSTNNHDISHISKFRCDD
jgi:hypothetical protein